MLLPTRWWPRTLEPLSPPLVGEEMLGFNNEAQGWLPCKIVETAPQEKLWTVDWWDNSQGDRTKGEEGLRPFEEAGWWYRSAQKTRAKEPNECIRTLRKLVSQWHQEEDTMDPSFPEEEMVTGEQNLATQMVSDAECMGGELDGVYGP